MSAARTLYVPQALYEWTSIRIGGLSADEGPDGSVGFLPIFATREDAETFAPGVEVLVIQPVPGTEPEQDQAP